MKKIHNINKKKKVGDRCICPSCGSKFTKKHYQQIFCKTKGGTICKDKYWNTVTPTKKNNITRISPASKRWLATMNRDYYDDMHPFEGLNDESYKIR